MSEEAKVRRLRRILRDELRFVSSPSPVNDYYRAEAGVYRRVLINMDLLWPAKPRKRAPKRKQKGPRQ